MRAASTTTIVRSEDGTRIRFRRLLLVVEEGPDRGREYDLEGGEVLLGRGETAAVRLGDAAVSREHCRIRLDTEGIRVVDLGSRSGTRIDGTRVESAPLEPGSRLEVGSTVLRLKAMESDLRVARHELEEFEGLCGASPAMRELFGLAASVAPLRLPVLIRGETGTGKEGLAKALHSRGERPEGPFVVVDCTLLGDPVHARSELFGHEAGAFTGAQKARPGAFARAHRGTLFLDEIGELPLEIQAQLLRVLQEGEIRPLGGGDPTRVQVRLVSATHRDLESAAVAGKFRSDLYFRLAGITLEVPPLRDRGRDAVLLARRFLPPGTRLSDEAEAAVLAHRWPGNVRELGFVMERAAALSRAGVLTAADLKLSPGRGPGAAAAARDPLETGPIPIPGGARPTGTPGGLPGPDDSARMAPLSLKAKVARLDAATVLAALEKAGGNRKEAARLLGVSRGTLYRKLAEFGLEG